MVLSKHSVLLFVVVVVVVIITPGLGVILDICGLGLGLLTGVTFILSAMLLYNVTILMTFEVFYLGKHPSTSSMQGF